MVSHILRSSYHRLIRLDLTGYLCIMIVSLAQHSWLGGWTDGQELSIAALLAWLPKCRL